MDQDLCDRFIKAITEIKTTYPDLRIGQVISNATFIYGGNNNLDVYYISDADLVRSLEEYTANKGKKIP
jgi:hypothetical protein